MPLRLLASVLLLITCTLPSDEAETPRLAETESPPVELLGAADIARCGLSNRAPQTSDLLVARPGIPVFLAGDNAYYDGTWAEYRDCYGPTWGRVKDRTLFPTPGNHEYHTTNSAGVVVQGPGAPGYFDYFNGIGIDSGVAGRRGQGYYARDYGGARIYGLNSELPSAARPAMVEWVKRDLAANPRACQIAIMHRPYFTTPTGHAPETKFKPLVEALVAGGVELLISGHNHHYERFVRMLADGTPHSRGIRQYVVGTGGSGTKTSLPPPEEHASGSEILGNVHGVIRLAIYSDRIDSEFIPIAGKVFADQATTACDGETEPPPPPPPPAPPPPASNIVLTVSGRRDVTKIYATLTWTGATGTTLQVYRNGVSLTTTDNDGRYTNSRAYSGPATYTYRVCELGKTVCSNDASVIFN